MASLIEQVNALPILPNSLALWGLGQSGVIVKGPDAVIYIDPYLSTLVDDLSRNRTMQRAFPTPLDPSAVTNADYILCTHEHIDHYDSRTVVPALASSPDAKVIMTKWNVEQARKDGIDQSRILTPDAEEPFALPGTSIRLTAVPAAHETRETDPDKGDRYFGYLIEWNGVTLFHAGDCVLYDVYVEMLRRLPKPDIAMLPINGRDWFRHQDNLAGNFNPREAVGLADLLGWELLIPLHNDLYPANSVPWTEFTAALDKFAPRQRYKQLQPGELLYYVKV